MSNVIRKTFKGTVESVDSTGTATAIISVTNNIDRQNDRIIPGAFAKALADKQSMPLVYGHRWDDLSSVLGRAENLVELMPGDPRLPDQFLAANWGGLKADLRFNLKTDSGRTAYALLKAGDLTEYSFAFTADDDVDEKSGVREIKSITEVFEATIALIGANPATTTLSVKAANPDTVTMALKGLSEAPGAMERPQNPKAALLAALAALLSD